MTHMAQMAERHQQWLEASLVILQQVDSQDELVQWLHQAISLTSQEEVLLELLDTMVHLLVDGLQATKPAPRVVEAQPIGHPQWVNLQATLLVVLEQIQPTAQLSITSESQTQLIHLVELVHLAKMDNKRNDKNEFITLFMFHD